MKAGLGLIVLVICIMVIITMCSTGSTNPLLLFDIPEGYLKDSYEYIFSNQGNFTEAFSKVVSLMEADDFETYNPKLIKNIESSEIDLESIDMYKNIFSNVIGGLVGNYEYNSINKVKKKVMKIKLDKNGRPIFNSFGIPEFEEVEEDTEVEEWVSSWGLRSYYPIPDGFKYTHYDDYGDPRDYKESQVHEGNDIVADTGTPIVNVESGYIENIGWNEYGGWRIGIRSLDNKRYLYYAHMSRYATYRTKGQKVEAGEVIGYVGNSGYGPEGTTGKFIPHLHFQLEVTYDDSKVYINPYHYLKFLENRKSYVEPSGAGDYFVKPHTNIRVN